MAKWDIQFIIKYIKSEEKIEHMRPVVKNETIINLEIDDMDLNIMLQCNDEFKTKFSYDKLFQEDKKNILNSEIQEKMILEYYISSYKLNFTDKKGIVNLSYPKLNLW